jgi:hypothetical protein
LAHQSLVFRFVIQVAIFQDRESDKRQSWPLQ